MGLAHRARNFGKSAVGTVFAVRGHAPPVLGDDAGECLLQRFTLIADVPDESASSLGSILPSPFSASIRPIHSRLSPLPETDRPAVASRLRP